MSLYQPNVETIENVRQYCSLFDSNPNAIIVIDPDRDPCIKILHLHSNLEMRMTNF